MYRYVLCLHCLHLTLFLSFLFACSVCFWERHIQVNATFNLSRWLLLTRVACIQGFLQVLPISNSKFMEWLRYVLDWIEADLCYVHMGLTLPWCCSMMIWQKYSYAFHVHSFRCIRQIMSKCFRKQNTINIKYKQHKWSRTLFFSLKHGAPIWYRSRLFGGCCSHPRSYPTFCRTKHLRLSPIDLPQPQTCFFTIKII